MYDVTAHHVPIHATGHHPRQRTFTQSSKLQDVLYEIRGPVHEHASRLEAEGHRIHQLVCQRTTNPLGRPRLSDPRRLPHNRCQFLGGQGVDPIREDHFRRLAAPHAHAPSTVTLPNNRRVAGRGTWTVRGGMT